MYDNQEQAKFFRKRYYQPKEPCKNGHIARHMTGTGRCTQCLEEAGQDENGRYIPSIPKGYVVRLLNPQADLKTLLAFVETLNKQREILDAKPIDFASQPR